MDSPGAPWSTQRQPKRGQASIEYDTLAVTHNRYVRNVFWESDAWIFMLALQDRKRALNDALQRGAERRAGSTGTTTSMAESDGGDLESGDAADTVGETGDACDDNRDDDCRRPCVECPPLEPVCLDRPEDQITVFPEGVVDEEYKEDLPADAHTLDMRGVVYEMPFLDTVRAVTAKDRLSGGCVVGVRVQGTQPLDVDWADVKNTDGVRFAWEDTSSVGPVTAEGIWVDNVGDGFEPPRYSGSAGLGYSWSLRSSCFRHIRDDVIENDACHPGEVNDVLVDESFIFLSTRPGSGNHLETGAEAPVISIENSLIHVGTEE